MKKILLIGILLLWSLSLFSKSVVAKSSPALSISDAIYADLAVRHSLDNVSLFYSDGKSSNEVRLNEKKHWLPASTVKSFAAMYAYKKIDEGTLHTWDIVTIDAKNNVPTELVTDQLPALLEGSSVTISRLIKQMITQSDNTAFNQLVDVLGRDNITSYIQSLGLTHSNVGSKLNLDTSQEQYEFDTTGYGINTTTAEDYAKAFRLIKDEKVAGAKDLLAVLKDQKLNDMIPFLLPKSVVCAHKTGDLDPLYHDGGICSDKNRSYVLTIFTNGGDPNLLAHLSQLIYTQNPDLVGSVVKKKSISELQNVSYPIDPLVMTTPPQSYVLGQNTRFSTPDITAADLGVKAEDLSQVINDKDLPKVLIPADSPFHILSDTWQVTKKIIVVHPKFQTAIDLETQRLRVAEAKDLIKRGKTKEAQVVLQNLQGGLESISKDKTIAHDPQAQNMISSVSETRFEVLKEGLNKAKGDDKVSIIREIADQAKKTSQQINPNTPNATNATNPSQKPLIGEVIKSDDSGVTVKTAGGQVVTVPAGDNIKIKEKQGALKDSNPEASPTPAATSLSSIQVGTTVALIGSSTNNTFSPSLILTNIPKELAAPQPVTVAKIDTKNNTMVVIENGVYTQVNVHKDTSIKGADTNIPLSAIKQGDIVVVHGEPLTNAKPIPSVSPSIIKAPGSIPTSSPNPQTQDKSVSPSIMPSGIPNPKTENKFNVSPSAFPSNLPKTTLSPSLAPLKSSGSQIPNNSKKNNLPSAVQNPSPRVIDSTSIRILEKKNAVQPPKEQPKSEPAKPKPASPPPTQTSTAPKAQEKKK